MWVVKTKFVNELKKKNTFNESTLSTKSEFAFMEFSVVSLSIGKSMSNTKLIDRITKPVILTHKSRDRNNSTIPYRRKLFVLDLKLFALEQTSHLHDWLQSNRQLLFRNVVSSSTKNNKFLFKTELLVITGHTYDNFFVYIGCEFFVSVFRLQRECVSLQPF